MSRRPKLDPHRQAANRLVRDSETVIGTRGGAAILKVRGTKHDSRAERARKKFLYPHFSKRGGYKQANVSFEYIEICCLVVALIDMS